MAGRAGSRPRLLITGGAGFIGSHLADELLAAGYAVRVLDNLCSQVHGPGQRRPAYLSGDVELVVGDVRDRACRRPRPGRRGRRLPPGRRRRRRPEHVRDRRVHEPEQPGHGGPARGGRRPPRADVRRLGRRQQHEHLRRGAVPATPTGSVSDAHRADARTAEAEPRVGSAAAPGGDPLSPLPTPESKPPSLASVYALSKFDQERMCLMVGRAYGIATTALRFFNVFGTRQALSNPYTGVLAIFASRLMNGRPPAIFEDGLAAAGLRQRDRRGPRLPARPRRCPTPPGGCSTSAPATATRCERWPSGSRQGRRAMPHVSAGRQRQVPRRRHPPLLRRHHASPSGCWGTSRKRCSRTVWTSWPPGCRNADGRRPRRRRHGRAGPPRVGHLSRKN